MRTTQNVDIVINLRRGPVKATLDEVRRDVIAGVKGVRDAMAPLSQMRVPFPDIDQSSSARFVKDVRNTVDDAIAQLRRLTNASITLPEPKGLERITKAAQAATQQTEAMVAALNRHATLSAQGSSAQDMAPDIRAKMDAALAGVNEQSRHLVTLSDALKLVVGELGAYSRAQDAANASGMNAVHSLNATAGAYERLQAALRGMGDGGDISRHAAVMATNAAKLHAAAQEAARAAQMAAATPTSPARATEARRRAPEPAPAPPPPPPPAVETQQPRVRAVPEATIESYENLASAYDSASDSLNTFENSLQEFLRVQQLAVPVMAEATGGMDAYGNKLEHAIAMQRSMAETSERAIELVRKLTSALNAVPAHAYAIPANASGTAAAMATAAATPPAGAPGGPPPAGATVNPAPIRPVPQAVIASVAALTAAWEAGNLSLSQYGQGLSDALSRLSAFSTGARTLITELEALKTEFAAGSRTQTAYSRSINAAATAIEKLVAAAANMPQNLTLNVNGSIPRGAQVAAAPVAPAQAVAATQQAATQANQAAVSATQAATAQVAVTQQATQVATQAAQAAQQVAAALPQTASAVRALRAEFENGVLTEREYEDALNGVIAASARGTAAYNEAQRRLSTLRDEQNAAAQATQQAAQAQATANQATQQAANFVPSTAAAIRHLRAEYDNARLSVQDYEDTLQQVLNTTARGSAVNGEAQRAFRRLSAELTAAAQATQAAQTASQGVGQAATAPVNRQNPDTQSVLRMRALRAEYDLGRISAAQYETELNNFSDTTANSARVVDEATTRLARLAAELARASGSTTQATTTTRDLNAELRDLNTRWLQAQQAGTAATMTADDYRTELQALQAQTRAGSTENARASRMLLELERHLVAVGDHTAETARRMQALTTAYRAGVIPLAEYRRELEDLAEAEKNAGRSGNAPRARVRETLQTEFRENLKRERRGVEAQREAIESQFGKAQVVQNAGQALTYSVSLPGVLAAKQGMQVILEYEGALRNANSIAKLSEEQFQALYKTVAELARDPQIKQGPVDLAKALYQIYSVSKPGQDRLELLRVSAKGASAGLTSTETAAKALTAVLNSGISGVTSATQAMDVMFKSVDVGGLTFEQFSHNIGDVLVNAKAAGISLQDIAAFVAMATQNGQGAEQAFNDLNNIIAKLIRPAKEAIPLFKQMGVSYGISGVQATGFTGILDQLVAAMGKQPDKLARMFEDMQAFRGILTATAKSGQSYRAMLSTMATASDDTGSAQEALTRQMESGQFQLSVLRKELELAAIESGPSLLRLLKELLTALKPTIEAITAQAKAFNELDKGQQQAILTVAAFVLALGPLVNLAGSASMAVLTLQRAQVAAAASAIAAKEAVIAGSAAMNTANVATVALASSTSKWAGLIGVLGKEIVGVTVLTNTLGIAWNALKAIGKIGLTVGIAVIGLELLGQAIRGIDALAGGALGDKFREYKTGDGKQMFPNGIPTLFDVGREGFRMVEEGKANAAKEENFQGRRAVPAQLALQNTKNSLSSVNQRIARVRAIESAIASGETTNYGYELSDIAKSAGVKTPFGQRPRAEDNPALIRDVLQNLLAEQKRLRDSIPQATRNARFNLRVENRDDLEKRAGADMGRILPDVSFAGVAKESKNLVQVLKAIGDTGIGVSVSQLKDESGKFAFLNSAMAGAARSTVGTPDLNTLAPDGGGVRTFVAEPANAADAQKIIVAAEGMGATTKFRDGKIIISIAPEAARGLPKSDLTPVQPSALDGTTGSGNTPDPNMVGLIRAQERLKQAEEAFKDAQKSMENLGKEIEKYGAGENSKISSMTPQQILNTMNLVERRMRAASASIATAQRDVASEQQKVAMVQKAGGKTGLTANEKANIAAENAANEMEVLRDANNRSSETIRPGMRGLGDAYGKAMKERGKEILDQRQKEMEANHESMRQQMETLKGQEELVYTEEARTALIKERFDIEARIADEVQRMAREQANMENPLRRDALKRDADAARNNAQIQMNARYAKELDATAVEMAQREVTYLEKQVELTDDLVTRYERLLELQGKRMKLILDPKERDAQEAQDEKQRREGRAAIANKQSREALASAGFSVGQSTLAFQRNAVTGFEAERENSTREQLPKVIQEQAKALAEFAETTARIQGTSVDGKPLPLAPEAYAIMDQFNALFRAGDSLSPKLSNDVADEAVKAYMLLLEPRIREAERMPRNSRNRAFAALGDEAERGALPGMYYLPEQTRDSLAVAIQKRDKDTRRDAIPEKYDDLLRNLERDVKQAAGRVSDDFFDVLFGSGATRAKSLGSFWREVTQTGKRAIGRVIITQVFDPIAKRIGDSISRSLAEGMENSMGPAMDGFLKSLGFTFQQGVGGMMQAAVMVQGAAMLMNGGNRRQKKGGTLGAIVGIGAGIATGGVSNLATGLQFATSGAAVGGNLAGGNILGAAMGAYGSGLIPGFRTSGGGSTPIGGDLWAAKSRSVAVGQRGADLFMPTSDGYMMPHGKGAEIMGQNMTPDVLKVLTARAQDGGGPQITSNYNDYGDKYTQVDTGATSRKIARDLRNALRK